MVDPDWLNFLKAGKTRLTREIELAVDVLRLTGLDQPSRTDTIAEVASRKLFSRPHVSLEEHVQLAHLLAALGAKTPEDFRWITRDGQPRKPNTGIVATQDPAIEALLLPQWAQAHLLHPAYFTPSPACSAKQWTQWSQSDLSGLLPFAPIQRKRTSISGRWQLQQVLESKGVAAPTTLPYNSGDFYLHDWDFPDEVVAYWTALAQSQSSIWASVAELVLQAPAWFWQGRTQATVSQRGRRGNEQALETDFIAAAWIMRLRALPCLPDTTGAVRHPAELYRRTSQTECLLGAEPFVRSDLDNEQTKDLLRLLGVRETPGSVGSLLARLRALAQAPYDERLLPEILKWYGALDRVLSAAAATTITECQQAFQAQALILTADHTWAKAAEVFLSSTAELPDAPVVHPAAAGLALWKQLGVVPQPTAQVVLDWLKRLPSGCQLDETSLRRVEAILKRYSTQAWEQCGHWLALDGSWAAVRTLRYRLTRQSLIDWSRFFPNIKAATANLQMLAAEVAEGPPFCSLPDLGSVIKYRPSRLPTSFNASLMPDWVAPLAEALMRVKLDDPHQTQHVRATAKRLAETTWRQFDAHDPVELTPYVDEVPAGPAQPLDVLWDDRIPYIQGTNLARRFGALVAELARPFNEVKVTEAIKACIQRSADFIADYMQEHFKLEAAIPAMDTGQPPTPTPEGQQPQPTDQPHQAIGVPGPIETPSGQRESDFGQTPGEATTPSSRGRRESGPSLFERFVLAKGYRPHPAGPGFIHPTGSKILRVDGLLPWAEYDAAGQLVRRYWAGEACLSGSGVQIASELWDMIRHRPDEISLVFENENHQPVEFTGSALLQLVSKQRLQVFPAAYRLRLQEPNNAPQGGFA